MKKIAFIFPGQGSQYVGMGKDFYETFPCAKEMIDLAEKVSGIPMKELLFEENENINITKYTQIAMLADELAIWSVLREKGVESAVNAGLSLGEYAALVASGVMTPEDAFRVVTKRGEFMQEAVPTGGAMTAVLGADTAVIENICEETEGIVSIANYNCPGQIVITGEQKAVDTAAAALKEAGAKRCTPLNVSGPFHTSLMHPAGDALREKCKAVRFAPMQFPVLFNCLGHEMGETDTIAALLEKQVQSGVRWEVTVRRLAELGVDAAIEIGPGRALTGFVKKTVGSAISCYPVETAAQLQQLLRTMKGA